MGAVASLKKCLAVTVNRRYNVGAEASQRQNVGANRIGAKTSAHKRQRQSGAIPR